MLLMNERSKDVRGWSLEELADRVARDLPPGSYVNLGIGLPEIVANSRFCRDIMFHSENGLVGMGPPPEEACNDLDLINAGKTPVTVLPGGAYVHQADSFAMIRGGHIDVCILGALQVSAAGDLANWSMGAEDEIPAVGGAMDLAVGARELWVLMRHVAKSEKPKIVESCTYPVTGRAVVRRIYTEFAILQIRPKSVLVRELAPGVDREYVEGITHAALTFE